jgi:hypothetical protein
MAAGATSMARPVPDLQRRPTTGTLRLSNDAPIPHLGSSRAEEEKSDAEGRPSRRTCASCWEEATRPDGHRSMAREALGRRQEAQVSPARSSASPWHARPVRRADIAARGGR